MVASNLYERAVETFGERNQLMVTMGELAECTAELAKVFIENREADEEAILDELADVCIMMSQAHIIYGDKLNQAIEKKLCKVAKHVNIQSPMKIGEDIAPPKGRSLYGRYICPKCYSLFETSNTNVRLGRTTTCCGSGFQKGNKASEQHGYYKSPLYRKWRDMNSRCSDTNHELYNKYGALGITVCKEWQDSFASFESWSKGNGWAHGLAIDKDVLCHFKNIEPKIYSPDTCIYISVASNGSFNNGKYLSDEVKAILIKEELIDE